MNFNNEYNMSGFLDDKIMNNSFNNGEMNYVDFTVGIKLDNRISDLYEDQFGDLINYRSRQQLDEKLYEFFLVSPYHKKYKTPKRVDKTDMIKMYYYFKDLILNTNNFSIMEIFIGFAEFFQINYEQLYNEIRIIDKEALLKDLNEKLVLNNRIKTKKLF